MKEILTPETLMWAEVFITLAPGLLMALTRRQRMAILQRDNYQCQFPMYSEAGGLENCGRTENLEVHHIAPQRWQQKMEGLSRKQRDTPRNLLTVCKAHHAGQIHPDTGDAIDMYRQGDKDAFYHMMEERDQLINEGVVYWNDDMDDLMRYRAEELTDAAVSKGWNFPKLKRRGKKRR